MNNEAANTTGCVLKYAMLGVCTALAAHSAYAVNVDAGEYVALPPGTDAALVYYQHAERDSLYARGNKISGRASLDSDVGILRYGHFMKLGDYTVFPEFLLPFGRLQAKDDVSSLGSASGAGDLLLGMPVWLVNDPAKHTYFGVTPYLFLPTGSYDRNRALNLGENRWKFALQAGYTTGLSDNLFLDLTGDVTWYGKNDEFGAQSATLKQALSYQGQLWLHYQLSAALDLRVGYSHTWGGETKVNGVAQHDPARQQNFALGTAYFFNPTTQAVVLYGRDISIENGFKESNRINLRVLKVF